MAKTKKQAKSAVPYVRRVLEDEYVHEQLRRASAGLRAAYGRVSSRRGEAAEDKKLYGHLREAATSARRAVLAVRRRPEPKRRGRKLLLVVVAGGGAAVALSGKGREKLRGAFASGRAESEGPAAGAQPAPEETAASASQPPESAPHTPR